jgi:hypothetical protein
MVWERRDLVAGKHLGLIHYSLDQWQANEPLIAAIPAALWQAGRIDLPANIADRPAALLAGLEMARDEDEGFTEDREPIKRQFVLFALERMSIHQ